MKYLCDSCENYPCSKDMNKMQVSCPVYSPMPKSATNADRIRSMSDEELAELWWERVDCGECPVHKECKLTGQDCKRLALTWLKQEGE